MSDTSDYAQWRDIGVDDGPDGLFNSLDLDEPFFGDVLDMDVHGENGGSLNLTSLVNPDGSDGTQTQISNSVNLLGISNRAAVDRNSGGRSSVSDARVVGESAQASYGGWSNPTNDGDASAMDATLNVNADLTDQLVASLSARDSNQSVLHDDSASRSHRQAQAALEAAGPAVRPLAPAGTQSIVNATPGQSRVDASLVDRSRMDRMQMPSSSRRDPNRLDQAQQQHLQRKPSIPGMRDNARHFAQGSSFLPEQGEMMTSMQQSSIPQNVVPATSLSQNNSQAQPAVASAAQGQGSHLRQGGMTQDALRQAQIPMSAVPGNGLSSRGMPQNGMGAPSMLTTNIHGTAGIQNIMGLDPSQMGGAPSMLPASDSNAVKVRSRLDPNMASNPQAPSNFFPAQPFGSQGQQAYPLGLAPPGYPAPPPRGTMALQAQLPHLQHATQAPRHGLPAQAIGSPSQVPVQVHQPVRPPLLQTQVSEPLQLSYASQHSMMPQAHGMNPQMGQLVMPQLQAALPPTPSGMRQVYGNHQASLVPNIGMLRGSATDVGSLGQSDPSRTGGILHAGRSQEKSIPGIESKNTTRTQASATTQPTFDGLGRRDSDGDQASATSPIGDVAPDGARDSGVRSIPTAVQSEDHCESSGSGDAVADHRTRRPSAQEATTLQGLNSGEALYGSGPAFQAAFPSQRPQMLFPTGPVPKPSGGAMPEVNSVTASAPSTQQAASRKRNFAEIGSLELSQNLSLPQMNFSMNRAVDIKEESGANSSMDDAPISLTGGQVPHQAPGDSDEYLRAKNREHARNTRLRKKAYLVDLKNEIESLMKDQERRRRRRLNAILQLSDRQSVRRRVMQTFFYYRATGETDLVKWQQILDPDFKMTLPVTPYRPFRLAEVQISTFGREVTGPTGMVEDVASMQLLLESVARRYGSKPKVRFTCGPQSTLLIGDTIMCRWVMKTEDAVVRGANAEVTNHGMLKAVYTPENRLSRVEMHFDVMEFMQHLSSMGVTPLFPDWVVPTTIGSALREIKQPCMCTEAEPPFRILHVNAAWSEICGYAVEDVRGKSPKMLQSPPDSADDSDKNVRPEDVQHVRKAMRVLHDARCASFVVKNYRKDGTSFLNYVRIIPLYNLNNGGNCSIVHYVGITKELTGDEYYVSGHSGKRDSPSDAQQRASNVRDRPRIEDTDSRAGVIGEAEPREDRPKQDVAENPKQSETAEVRQNAGHDKESDRREATQERTAPADHFICAELGGTEKTRAVEAGRVKPDSSVRPDVQTTTASDVGVQQAMVPGAAAAGAENAIDSGYLQQILANPMLAMEFGQKIAAVAAKGGGLGDFKNLQQLIDMAKPDIAEANDTGKEELRSS